MTTTAMKSLLQAKRNEIKELAWITVSQSNAFERIQENKFLVFKQQQENDNRERERQTWRTRRKQKHVYACMSWSKQWTICLWASDPCCESLQIGHY
jgi:hypothetical protein